MKLMKRTKVGISILCALVPAAALGVTAGAIIASIPKQDVKKIELSVESKTIDAFDDFYIKATLPEGVSGNINWSQSSNDGGEVELSKVSSTSGEEILVSGKKNGTVILTADFGAAKSTCTVVVNQVTERTNYRLTYNGYYGYTFLDEKGQSDVTLKPGYTYKIKTTINDMCSTVNNFNLLVGGGGRMPWAPFNWDKENSESTNGNKIKNWEYNNYRLCTLDQSNYLTTGTNVCICFTVNKETTCAINLAA